MWWFLILAHHEGLALISLWKNAWAHYYPVYLVKNQAFSRHKTVNYKRWSEFVIFSSKFLSQWHIRWNKIKCSKNIMYKILLQVCGVLSSSQFIKLLFIIIKQKLTTLGQSNGRNSAGPISSFSRCKYRDKCRCSAWSIFRHECPGSKSDHRWLTGWSPPTDTSFSSIWKFLKLHFSIKFVPNRSLLLNTYFVDLRQSRIKM